MPYQDILIAIVARCGQLMNTGAIPQDTSADCFLNQR